jgi:hypothetical protein
VAIDYLHPEAGVETVTENEIAPSQETQPGLRPRYAMNGNEMRAE